MSIKSLTSMLLIQCSTSSNSKGRQRFLVLKETKKIHPHFTVVLFTMVKRTMYSNCITRGEQLRKWYTPFATCDKPLDVSQSSLGLFPVLFSLHLQEYCLHFCKIELMGPWRVVVRIWHVIWYMAPGVFSCPTLSLGSTWRCSWSTQPCFSKDFYSQKPHGERP